MMADKDNSELGTVKISQDVVVAYVNDAVLETPGVVDFSGGLSDTISHTILGKDSKYKGVKIDEDDGAYSIDVYVIMAYGAHIPETAWNIQKNVKAKLEDVMAAPSVNVNIHVQGVQKSGKPPALEGSVDA
jgi:uncharacterized alkaline shock family protein YloU